MSQPLKVSLRTDQRAAFVGKTGSGKTYLARAFTQPVRRLVVLDPKGTLSPELAPEWNLEPWTQDNVRKLKRGDNIRLRVPAPLDENWAPYLQTVWDIGNILVYIDEVYGVVNPGSKPPAELNALYTRGRERGIGVWASTQRPAWVPLIVLSESEWLFMMRLMLDKDRARMAEIMGAKVLNGIPPRDNYGYWFFNASWNEALYSSGLKLRMPRRENVA